MRKKTIILLIILAAVAGGFLYFWYVWIPAQIEKENNQQVSTTTPPTLFGKDDYKIEERADGEYIVVKKVGLTAKVPEGWKIEIKGDDVPEPEYWVDVYSPDTETTSGVAIKGCGISLFVGSAIERIKELKNSIESLHQNPESNRPCSELLGTSECPEYTFEVIEITGHQALKQISPKHEFFGHGVSISIPYNDKILIDLTTRFIPGYEEKCYPIWKEFLKNIKVE
ncbi:hypothetical protein J7J23_01545 [bacterium]|nr:hypothetical protein [bacterium]